MYAPCVYTILVDFVEFSEPVGRVSSLKIDMQMNIEQLPVYIWPCL
jgi:hypothetical protein